MFFRAAGRFCSAATLFLGVAGAAVMVGHGYATAEEGFDPARLEKTTVVSGLTQPMEMAIAPDGTIYLIELAGQIKAIE